VARNGVRFGILHSDESEGRETTSSFAFDEGACVTLNAGYFRMDLSPSKPIGLLMVDSSMVQNPTPSVLRNQVSYPVARAAIGIDPDGRVDIAWVASSDSGLVEINPPPPNREGEPVTTLDSASARIWPMYEAVSAGPSLVSDGTVRITVEEEVFFGSAIPNVHPRSAIGIDSEGRVILLVVDGRQSGSRGVDLQDLADIMLDLGAVEAMNLDGGGSSALVVDGILLNRPAGADLEREVASALAVYCE
jgi:exopolysaccharide biosynthesis protein